MVSLFSYLCPTEMPKVQQTKGTQPAIAPIVKWAGGKRQLLPTLQSHLPKGWQETPYCEPFLGGGALLWALQPRRAVVGDLNAELMNMYRVVRDTPHELVSHLRQHLNTSEYFYQLRMQDRDPNFASRSPLERASRFIYLNKTCYNGLFRVNNAGEFNSPYGRYKHPNIVNRENILAVSHYLNHAEVTLTHGDYQEVLEQLPATAFVYLDPPYHPLSDTSSFTGYVQGGWKASDQERLRDACRALHRRGVRFMQSNSDTPLIRSLYEEFELTTVQAVRAVNSKGTGRGAVSELIIRNYVEC